MKANNVVGEGVVLNYVTYIGRLRIGIGGSEREFREFQREQNRMFMSQFDPARSAIAYHRSNMFPYDSLKSFHFVSINLVTAVNSGEFHLGYTKDELNGSSWYQLVHWDNIKEAQMKHKLSKFPFIVQLSAEGN